MTATRLVGRRGELQRAKSALAELQHGVGAIVLVEGEAGIGKSTLARAVAATTHLDPLRGAASELEAGLAFSLWVRVLRLRRSAESDLQRELAQAITAPDAATSAQLRIIDGIAELIEREAVSGPTLLLLDDLHWADTRSLAALARVAELARDLPVGIIATRRPWPVPDGADTWWRDLDREGRVTRLPLGPLPHEDLLALAGDLLGEAAGADLTERLDRTGGNPLLAREVTLLAADPADDTGHTDDLQETVLRHLGFLPEATWEPLRTAAALGTTFDPADGALVHAQDVGEFVADLHPAVASRILVEAEGLAFAHDVVREAVQHSETAPERAARHARIATALVEAGHPPHAWASHLVQADAAAVPMAAERFAEAGRDLLHKDLGGAAALLQRGLDLDPGLAEARLDLFIATFMLAPYRHRELSNEAKAILRPLLSEEALAATTSLVRARLLCWSEALDAEQLARVVAAARDHGLPDALGPALDLPWERQHAFAINGLDGEEWTQARGTITALGASEDPLARYLAALWTWIGSQHTLVSEARREIAAARHALAANAEHPGVLDPAQVISLQEFVLQAGQRSRELALEFETVTACERLAAELRDMGSEEEARFIELLRLDALWEDPVACADELKTWASVALAWLEEGDLPDAFTTHWLSRWFSWVDDRERAERALAAAHPDRANTWQAKAYDAWATGNTAEAADHLTRAANAQGDGTTWAVKSQQYAFARRIGRPDIYEGEPFTTRSADEDPLAAPVRDGDPDAILAVLADGHPPIGYFGLDIREDVADLLAEQGRTDEAIEVLRQSLADWHGIGATQCVRRVNARLRELGVSPYASNIRTAATHGWESITEAEWRVLDLLEQDLIYREIAERLFLSRRTVESHVASVFRKLQVKGRRNLARMLREGEGADQLAQARQGTDG